MSSLTGSEKRVQTLDLIEIAQTFNVLSMQECPSPIPRPVKIKEGSLAEKVYGATRIDERHRHRYEYNNDYRERLEKAGLKISGTSPDGLLVEMVEMDTKNHPYFIAGQFHPELKSRPNKPAPLFVGLVKACIDKK